MYGFSGGTFCTIVYFLICVAILLILRCSFKVPQEIFRKMLHSVLLGSMIVWIFAFKDWYSSVAFAVIFMVAVFPILKLLEHIKGYSEFLTERKSGELKNSLLIVFSMYSIVATVCWGIFEDKFLALASIFAWGLGDAGAALVGKRFGRHYLEGRHIEGRKSWEGTLTMFALSFISVFTILMIRGGMPGISCAVIALVVGAVSAVAELFSLSGNDTIFCPLAAMAALIPLTYLFGGL